jgi:hypothetical protein
MSFAIDMSRSNLCFEPNLLEREVQVTTTISDSWITRLQINLIGRYKFLRFNVLDRAKK